MTKRQIRKLIEDHFNIDISERTRKHSVAHYRFLYYTLCYNYSSEVISLERIGESVGYKNHATVLNGINEFDNICKSNKVFKKKIQDFMVIFIEKYENSNNDKQIIIEKLFSPASQIRLLKSRIRQMNKAVKKLEKLCVQP